MPPGPDWKDANDSLSLQIAAIELRFDRALRDLKSEQIADLRRDVADLENYRGSRAQEMVDMLTLIHKLDTRMARFEAGSYVLYLGLLGVGGIIGWLTHFIK